MTTRIAVFLKFFVLMAMAFAVGIQIKWALEEFFKKESTDVREASTHPEDVE